MKTFLKPFLFFIFIWVIETNGQSRDQYNIKLKSGLEIKCKIVSIIPDSVVVINQFGTYSNIPCADIVAISYIQAAPGEGTLFFGYGKKHNLRSLPEKKWTFGFHFGPNLEFADGDYGSQFKLTAFKGINKHWEKGFCLGVDVYEYSGVFGSIAGELRCNILSRPQTPFCLYKSIDLQFLLKILPQTTILMDTVSYI